MTVRVPNPPLKTFEGKDQAEVVQESLETEHTQLMVDAVRELQTAGAGTVDLVSNVGTARILGRTTAGSGDSEEMSAATTKTLLAITEADITDLGTYSTATGVENDADVTDTANVTSSGALMDSELASISDVKGLDQDVSNGAAPVLDATNMTNLPTTSSAVSGVSAYLTTTQGISANTITTVAGYTVVRDIGSDFNAVTGEFTARITGFHRFSGKVIYQVASDSDQIFAYLYDATAGSNLDTNIGETGGPGSHSVPFNRVLSLTAGDVVDVRARNTNNADTLSGGALHTCLDITQV
jgi:hypothetical protein